LSINERVKEARKALSLTQTTFAKRIAISNGYIAGIELGQRNVNERLIKLISSEFGINEKWLKTGEGLMLASDKKKEKQIETLINIFEELSPDMQAFFVSQVEALLTIQKEKNNNPSAED